MAIAPHTLTSLQPNTIMTPSLRQHRRLGAQPSKRAKTILRARNRASFATTSQLVIVPGRESVGAGVWYTEQEMKRLKASNVRSIVVARVLLAKHARDDSDASTYPRAEILGLERHLSDELMTAHKRRKRNDYRAVGVEQGYQRTYDCRCPERLARASLRQSKNAMRLARLRALSLEHELASS